MTNLLKNFFETNDICEADDIMYLIKIKNTNITEFHLKDGRILTKYISLGACNKQLPSEIFIPINRGIIINKHYIKCINRYIYHMQDGTIFEGKLKATKLHKKLKDECTHHIS